MNNLNYVLVAIFTVFSITSSAHLEIGTYTGKLENGDACSFEVKAVTFKDNVRHPLNERVAVVAEGKSFELSHLPMLDIEKIQVLPEDEILTGVVGIPSPTAGAIAARLVMGEKNEVHGPQVFTLVFDDYKKNENDKVIVCKDLVAPEEK